MEHLAGTDSYFLYTERGNVYNHVASLGIYDPSTAPGGQRPVQGHPALFQQTAGREPGVPAAARDGAARCRPAVLAR